MIDYIIYNTTNGYIEKTISVVPDDLILNIPDGFSALPSGEVGDDSKSYVDINSQPHKHTPRLALSLPDSLQCVSDGINEAVISSIPSDVFVTWPDGLKEEVTDGVVEFSTTQPGIYKLLFTGVKYLDKEVTIEATI